MLLLNSYMETKIYEDEESKYVRFVYTSRQEMEKNVSAVYTGDEWKTWSNDKYHDDNSCCP